MLLILLQITSDLHFDEQSFYMVSNNILCDVLISSEVMGELQNILHNLLPKVLNISTFYVKTSR